MVLNELTINPNYDLLACMHPTGSGCCCTVDYLLEWERLGFKMNNALETFESLNRVMAIEKVIGSWWNLIHSDFEFQREPTALKELRPNRSSQTRTWRKCNNKSHWKHPFQLIASVWPAASWQCVFIEHCSSVLLYHKFDLKFSSKWTVWQDAGTCYRSETEAFRFEHTRCSINWCSIRDAKASSSTDSVRQYIHSFNSLSPASLDGCYVNFELRRVLSLRKLAKELLSPVESRKVSKIPWFESDECIQWAGFHSINFVNWDLNLELLRHAFRNFHIIF